MKRAVLSTVLALVFSSFFPGTARAQVLTSGEPVVYGHHHLNTTNMEAQKKFYVEALGGKLLKIGANQQEVIAFPGVLMFFRPMQAPTGGTIGTTVNHI